MQHKLIKIRIFECPFLSFFFAVPKFSFQSNTKQIAKLFWYCTEVDKAMKFWVPLSGGTVCLIKHYGLNVAF